MLLIWGVLVTNGCGRTLWYSATKDSQTFRKDLFQCEGEAAIYSSNMGEPGKKSIVDKRLLECMKLRGYGRADESDIPEGVTVFR